MPDREASRASPRWCVAVKLKSAAGAGEDLRPRPRSGLNLRANPGGAAKPMCCQAVAACASPANSQSNPPVAHGDDSADLVDARPPRAEDETEFSEVPTVANRANPTSSPRKVDREDASPRGTPARAGAYRLVRPAISDQIAVPSPAGAPRPSGNRLVIGIARKSH